MEISLQICVIGSSTPSEEEKKQAYRVGKRLGEEDATLICGGGKGVMKASCRGVCESSGGQTVGVLPGSSQKEGNAFLDIIIPTGIGHARNVCNVLAGQAVIAVGGRYGTLSEIAFACIHDRPVFGVNTWSHPDFDFPTELSPEEAVQQAIAVAGKYQAV